MLCTPLPKGFVNLCSEQLRASKLTLPFQGESITIPCSASGSPKPTIVWEHEAFNQQPVVVYQDGPSELLHLANLTANSTGEYSCKIWNNRGRRILRKTLVFVAEKPRAIISSFSPEPHTEGGPLDLFCEAEGFPRPQVHHQLQLHQCHL